MSTSLIIWRTEGRKSSAALVRRMPSTRCEKQLDGAFLFIKTVVAIAQQQIVSVFLRGIFRAANDHGEKRVGDIRHDHADRVGAPLRETAGDEIRPVVEVRIADSTRSRRRLPTWAFY